LFHHADRRHVPEQVFLALGGSLSILYHIGKRADLSNVLWDTLDGSMPDGADMFGITDPILNQTQFKHHVVFQIGAAAQASARDVPTSVQQCWHAELHLRQMVVPPLDDMRRRIQCCFLDMDAEDADDGPGQPALRCPVNPLNAPDNDVAGNPALRQMMRTGALDVASVAAYLRDTTLSGD